MEEGRVEKEEELRRLTRHKEQLDRASKRMVDSAVGTQERVYSQEDFAEKESEVREARREVSSLKTGLELEKSKRVSVEAKWRTDAARHRTEMVCFCEIRISLFRAERDSFRLLTGSDPFEERSDSNFPDDTA